MSGETFDDADFEEVEGEDMDTEHSGADDLLDSKADTELDARRRLEERLEEQRLQKQLADYDFDD